MQAILEENEIRLSRIATPFNPYTGLNSPGEPRVEVYVPDFPVPRMWLPQSMIKEPLVQNILKYKTIGSLIRNRFPDIDNKEEVRQRIISRFVRIRCKYDFPFWAATFTYVKCKGGGADVLLCLTRPQRKFVQLLENMRTANRPIRIILLKARQWGGSTVSQMYMAWLQLIHQTGLNSAIIAQTRQTSYAIKDMFDRALNAYPLEMLHAPGESYDPKEAKYENVGQSSDYKRIPQRNCKIRIGSYEAADSLRGDDYNLVHCSEVGLWSATPAKTPDDVVRAVCSGVLYQPLTMIVYESTANGTGNFFQREYDAAKAGKSQFSSLFISWFDIDKYSIPFENEAEKREFAEKLYKMRKSKMAASNREESGEYLWSLWKKGATLEAINWYVIQRSSCNEHAVMASEYPSDDVEAFVHSGQMVFSQTAVNDMRPSCRPPLRIGEVFAKGDTGRDAFVNLHFKEDAQGMLHVWDLPDPEDPDEEVLNRYLVVVDVGGRSAKADWSVILVLDRIMLMSGGGPAVVAQWYGHIDMDILAWKAAQIAAFYDNALLVIESNTLETKDRERSVDGDQSQFILNLLRDEYPNLYARRQSADDIRNKVPVKYGFHTNISTKPMIISTLVKAVRDGMYTERDERCLDELLCYERRPNGSFGAVVGKHDDLLMTRAIGLHVSIFEMDVPKVIPRKRITANERRKPLTEASF